MKFNLKSTLFACVALHITTFATAGIIVDTSNGSFIDDNTQLEWIDFGINNGRSFNYVASQLGDGGEYEGWSLASKEQVYEMWANAFLGLGASIEIPDLFGPGQLLVADGGNKSQSVLFDVAQKMGVNASLLPGTLFENHLSFGLFNGTDGLSFVSSKIYQDKLTMLSPFDDFVSITDYFNADFYLNLGIEEYSTMLVKQSTTVPSPSTTVILALGLLGVALHRRKNV
tara:strand:+ start:2529 stop:3212 length:684 start_codon:yes stop_codon:yes gene_type:complete